MTLTTPRPIFQHVTEIPYSPLKRQIHVINDDIEPFPDFKDYAQALIMKRTRLIDSLHRRTRKPPRSSREADIHVQLLAMVSRTARSGQLMHNEHIVRRQSIAERATRKGKRDRDDYKKGNKMYPINRRGEYLMRRKKLCHEEPSAWVQNAMKERSVRGIEQALKYEAEFGMDFFNDLAAGRIDTRKYIFSESMRRTPPGALDPMAVASALVTLTNTFPREFQRDEVTVMMCHDKPVDTNRRAHTNFETIVPRDSLPTLSPPPQKNRFSLYSTTGKASLATFSSVDTFGAGVDKLKATGRRITSAVKRGVSKIPGLRRLGAKKVSCEQYHNTSVSPAGQDSELTPFDEIETGIDALQGKLDRMSQ